jgi:hypothetical protein
MDYKSVSDSRHLGRLGGEGHRRGKKDLHVHSATINRSDDYDRSHLVVLQHITVVRPYVHMHMKLSQDQNPQKKSVALMKERNTNFAKWLKNHFEENLCSKDDEETLDLYYLAHGPLVNIVTHQAYGINGYTFYMETQDLKIVYQNSVVTMKALTGKENDTY